MKLIERTNRFKKEYQRHVVSTELAEEFSTLVRLLATGAALPPRYRDHPLKGSLAGCRDFHLRADLVVIYQVTSSTVKFIRIGSHSELFG